MAQTGNGPRGGVPDEAARRLYLAILAEGGRLPTDRVTPADRPSMDQLVRIGLVMPHPMDRSYVAVSPRLVGDRVGADLRSQATGLLLEAERLPDRLASLTRAYDALPREPEARDHVSYVDGQERIRHRIAELVSECRQELLTVQPGSRLPETMELARRQDLTLLERGSRMRTLYQPLVLAEPATVAYAVELTGHGAEVRVLDENFQRMIIVDRAVAVIPAADDHSRAVLLSDPATVHFLVMLFERDWGRADVVQWQEVDPQRASRLAADRIGRLLAKGLTQRAVATRLGLSERTVAGQISRLRERYGAQTLFQLGWLMRGGGGRP
ncbi:TrmB family transcriptional regulator sugar-binding domain-containing protein [Kitasatospora sp. NPDC049258]|uniref:TrmB family transcriptional regulator sugar-binding domain-containing protein n=1 Tax=Kitasatospora sp. NPDC049258 TaxID=3155394 RepID=UPI0034232D7C